MAAITTPRQRAASSLECVGILRARRSSRQQPICEQGRPWPTVSAGSPNESPRSLTVNCRSGRGAWVPAGGVDLEDGTRSGVLEVGVFGGQGRRPLGAAAFTRAVRLAAPPVFFLATLAGCSDASPDATPAGPSDSTSITWLYALNAGGV